jgi:hypothetical protein
MKESEITMEQQIMNREEQIRRRDSKMRTRDWLRIIIMPIWIAILTAFLGIYLQNRSFERNTLFKARLDQIQSGQKEAVELYKDMDSTLRFIRTNEDFIQKDLNRFQTAGDPEQMEEARHHYCEGSFMIPSIESLGRYKIRTVSIEDYSASADQNSVVNTAIKDFSNKLGQLIECMDNKECRPCNDRHDGVRDSLKAVIGAHTKLVNELLEKNK